MKMAKRSLIVQARVDPCTLAGLVRFYMLNGTHLRTNSEAISCFLDDLFFALTKNKVKHTFVGESDALAYLRRAGLGCTGKRSAIVQALAEEDIRLDVTNVEAAEVLEDTVQGEGDMPPGLIIEKEI